MVVAAEMEDVKAHPSCLHCGMDRDGFSYSRGLVEYEGGEQVGTCSLHCNVVELKRNPGRKVKAVRIADYDTRELLDARAATWVIGGRKQGVMTRTAKWAFANREAAAAFVAGNGGEIVPYEEALAAAKRELEGGAGGAAETGKPPEGKAGGSCCDSRK